MRIVKGKRHQVVDAAALAAWAAGLRSVTVDLGAGDGRFVRHLAQTDPAAGAIGVDLCAANLRTASRTASDNALFVVADALALPAGLSRMATRVTVNFPWGSLLRGLLDGHPGLLTGLRSLGADHLAIELLLNADALAEAGCTFEAGADRVREMVRRAGGAVGDARLIGPADLRRRPTTWAKRLAFGRDPRAVQIEATIVRG
jgi:16S rRNA (adenine(1408)-N(1))-methyltransferase